jgi:lipopolysaccharide heptosyltransferase III
LRRVLVVQRAGVGDMVLTTPLLALLKAHLPGVEIDVLASRRNAGAVAGDPSVTEVFVHDETWRSWLRLLPRLRGRRYDAIFTAQEGKHLREALTATAVAHRGTYKISAWRPKRYQGLFTTVARVPRSATHTAERVLYVGCHALGRRTPVAGAVSERYPLRVAVDARADARVGDLIAAHGIGQFVAVNLSAHFAVRDWTPDRCAEFIALLVARHPDLSVILTPAPGKEKPIHEVLRQVGGPRVIGAPLLPLPGLVALVRRAFAVVTPNTALVHLASACRRPVIALYAPEVRSDVTLWLPIGVPYRAVSSDLRRSMADISPTRVADAFDDLRRDLESRTTTQRSLADV